MEWFDFACPLRLFESVEPLRIPKVSVPDLGSEKPETASNLWLWNFNITFPGFQAFLSSKFDLNETT